MKRNLFVIGLTAFLTYMALPSYAELTTADITDDNYLRNHGYSQATINMVNKNMAQVNGEEYKQPVENELYETPVIKYVRRFFMYIDPGLDDHKFNNDHDISPTTKWSDL